MDICLILTVALILLLAYYTHTLQMHKRKMPPGPFVIPILGSAPSIWLRRPVFKLSWIRPWEYFDMLSKTYGDLFSCCVFGVDALIIASYELFEEVSKMEEYNAKFANKYITYPLTFGKEMGLIFANSTALWTEMRKFTMRTLREFGFGKSYTVHSVITEEIGVLITEFKKNLKQNSGVSNFRNTFSLPVLNVLWCMVAGSRYEHDDPRLLKLLDLTYNVAKSSTFGNPFEVFTPLTRKFAPGFLSAKLRQDFFDEIHQFFKILIEERQTIGRYLTEPENYIDVFLRRIHKCRDEKHSLYTEEQLQCMLTDLFLVGSLTTNATLNYGILFITLNQDVQKKCQSEIDSIVPRHMAPTVDDIKRMPYFQAFLLELHRCANVIPNPIPRLTPKDWNLRGYKIPKGTLIISNHYTVNKDDRIWGDADTFRPERFINDNGDFAPDPRVVVFGFGKRICIGIDMVNSIIPLFIVSMLKSFNFAVAPGTPPPTTDPEIGLSLSPKEFPVLITLREEISKAPA